jgi:hypothetical protein
MRRGRPPSIWRAKAGKAFVMAVVAVKSNRYPIKTTDAINIVLRKPEFARLRQRYKLRYLEKKFQEVSDFSNPYARLSKEMRKARAIYRNTK